MAKRLIVEALGSPDAGKTTALKALTEKLNSKGIPTEFIVETRGKNIFPKSERGTLQYNCKVAGITCKRIFDIIQNSRADVILVDKGYVDFLYWNNYYYSSGKCYMKEKEEADQLYKELELMPNVVVAMICSPEEATRRCEDPLETRTVKVQQSIDALMDFYNNWSFTPKFIIDTTSMTKEQVVDELEAII